MRERSRKPASESWFDIIIRLSKLVVLLVVARQAVRHHNNTRIHMFVCPIAAMYTHARTLSVFCSSVYTVMNTRSDDDDDDIKTTACRR